MRAIDVDLGGDRPIAGALALDGGAVGLARGEVVIWVDGGAVRSLPLDFSPASLSQSADGRLLGAVAAGGEHFSVFELPTLRELFSISAPDARRQPLTAAICEDATGPVAVFSRRPGELEVFHPGGRDTRPCNLATFRAASLLPIAGGRFLGLLGHFEGESKDSMAVISLSAVLRDPDALRAQLAGKTGVTDYAYRLALGPFGPNQLICARDPEDDEDDEDGGAQWDLQGLRGFYVRGVDGAAGARLPHAGAIPTGASIGGRDGIVAYSEGDRISALVLASPADTVTIDASWLACAPDGRRVLASTPDGRATLLSWSTQT